MFYPTAEWIGVSLTQQHACAGVHFPGIPCPGLGSGDDCHLRRSGAAHELHLIDEAVMSCPSLQLQFEGREAERLLKKYSLKRALNWFASRGEVALSFR